MANYRKEENVNSLVIGGQLTIAVHAVINEVCAVINAILSSHNFLLSIKLSWDILKRITHEKLYSKVQ